MIRHIGKDRLRGALAVGCPVCGAVAGVWCRDESVGERVQFAHQGRLLSVPGAVERVEAAMAQRERKAAKRRGRG